MLEKDNEWKVSKTARRVQLCDTEIVEVDRPFIIFVKQSSTTTITTTVTWEDSDTNESEK